MTNPSSRTVGYPLIADFEDRVIPLSDTAAPPDQAGKPSGTASGGFPLVADFENAVKPLAGLEDCTAGINGEKKVAVPNRNEQEKRLPPVPSRPAIRAGLLEGRLTWAQGQQLIIKHCTDPDPLTHETARLLEILEAIRRRRDLIPREQELLDELLDSEWSLLPEPG